MTSLQSLSLHGLSEYEASEQLGDLVPLTHLKELSLEDMYVDRLDNIGELRSLERLSILAVSPLRRLRAVCPKHDLCSAFLVLVVLPLPHCAAWQMEMLVAEPFLIIHDS